MRSKAVPGTLGARAARESWGGAIAQHRLSRACQEHAASWRLHCGAALTARCAGAARAGSAAARGRLVAHQRVACAQVAGLAGDDRSVRCCKQLQIVSTVLGGRLPSKVRPNTSHARLRCPPWGMAAGRAAAGARSSSPSRPGRSARVTSPLWTASFWDSMVSKLGRRGADGWGAARTSGARAAAARQGAQRAGWSDVLRVWGSCLSAEATCGSPGRARGS